MKLVLHGANDFEEHHFKECIKRGMAKSNINEAMNGPFKRVMREKAESVPITTLLEQATLAMQKAVEELMDWHGSTGQA